VAFWENAKDIASGALEAVPEADGTEIILESTANGVQGLFYNKCMQALKGVGEYQIIFTPWWWNDEYNRTAPDDIALSDEEKKYKAAHELDNNQIYWRRHKIINLESEWLFKQEYPANIMEAFQNSGDDSYISSEIVQESRHGTPTVDMDAPLIIGVDPAYSENKQTKDKTDKTAIVFREGRVVPKIITFKVQDTQVIADRVEDIIIQHNPLMVNIDVGGVGAGVYDALVRRGYGDVVRNVNFGWSAIKEDKFKNKRAEMWHDMRSWLKDEPNQIPDDDELQADLTAPLYTYDDNQCLKLEKKEDMRKRLGRSPDKGDALALTFAYKVREPLRRVQRQRQQQQTNQESIMY